MLIGEGDSLCSMGFKFLNTYFKFVEELYEKPITFDRIACLMTDSCGCFLQFFWEAALFSVDVQSNADNLKRFGLYRCSTFAKDAANLALGNEQIIRPFYRDVCCSNRFDGLSCGQGSHQWEP